MEDVRSHDAGMQRRPEGVETRQTQFPADYSFVRKAAADASILFRNRRTKQPSRAGFGPDVAVVHALLVPGVEVWRILGGNKAPCLLLEQHEFLGHPAGTRKAKDVHDEAVDRAPYTPPRYYARASDVDKGPPLFTTARVDEGTFFSWNSQTPR